MKITASKLRENVYQILDNIISTGEAVEIVRKGQILRIVPAEKRSRLANLPKRDLLNCDPEDLVHIDWSSEWNELKRRR